MFSQKLDILMNIAGVSNSRLGQAIGMNSSHIGRLRNGKRVLPKKHEWLPNVCKYIEKHITKPYQFELLEKIAGIKADEAESSCCMWEILQSWLLSDDNYAEKAAEKFLDGFTNVTSPEMKKLPSNGSLEESLSPSHFFYGNEGKRQAVIKFFSLILKEEKPQTLLLFSEENMAWLYEDPGFAKKWALLFTKVLMKGNRVKIIHNMTRDLNELMEAVSKWVPIYMTGAVESYCYPRLRDGLFKRTMFIAPSTAAVVSSSVHEETEGMLNLFITDRGAVDALIREYNEYFRLCKPLMQLFTKNNIDEFFKALSEMIAYDGNSYTRSAVLPLFAVPPAMMQEFQKETAMPVLDLWQKVSEAFKERIKKYDIYITVPPVKLKSADASGFSMPAIELAGMGNFKYDEKDYLIHLERLLAMEKEYRNLHVCINDELPESTHLYVKEEYGVVLIKTNEPSAAFITKESNMTNAFGDYAKMKYKQNKK